MNISDFTLVGVFAHPNTLKPKVALLFDNEQDPLIFFKKYIVDSEMDWNMGMKDGKNWLILEFPKQDYYQFGMEIDPKGLPFFNKILGRDFEITCGYVSKEGKAMLLGETFKKNVGHNMN